MHYRQEVAFFSKLLEPDCLCFDVGANIGEKTEVLFRSGARVVAFEPQLDCMRKLEARCYNDRNKLYVCKKALGAEAGEAVLNVHEFRGQASLHENWGEGTLTQSLQVPVITLDHAITEFGKPSYCKIDVEGWELEVLKGLTQPIPLLSFEYHLNQKHDIDNALACLDYLSQFGDLSINITPSSRLNSFTYQKWMSLEKFLRFFPNGFQGHEEYSYGDIYIRTN
ncbi:FkbM family methyltransferase [Chlorogloeopsis sp. ULAP02]|uniref:FkbM family methyltransferase n=1 Tax=Chlorogloeopsis sp. ULAP02 TaxID=3107926 RepID=UPI003135D278